MTGIPAARLQHAPAETASWQARQDAEQQVISTCHAGAHEAEMAASHQCTPSPPGATPASGGA